MNLESNHKAGKGPARGGRQIIFVCGALRSGTTLLRLMLKHHPQMSNPGEMDFLFECPTGADGKRDIEAYKSFLRLNRIFGATGLPIDETLDYTDLVHSFVAGVRQPGKVMSVNLHRNFERVPEIFPDARYIHLLRDPRDVARSSIGMGWAGNVYHGVDHWIDSERSFEKLEGQISADKIYSLKNEDLIADAERALTPLCAFMGVPYDARMLTYPENSTYSAPDIALVNQWRRLQSEREVGLVEGKMGMMLRARGYAPSGYKVLIPNRFERMRLQTGNRIGRLRTVLRRYGPVLTGLDIVSRRLPLPGLREVVQRRMNEKAVQFLK
jgi:sulfotransferase family protein